MEVGTCPICLTEIRRLARYPLSICKTCLLKENIKDVSGNPVDFINTSFEGGFASLHTVDGKVVQKEEHICFVKGVKCYADEGRFGGIVIETYNDEK
jgi:hypothetical protein